MSVSDLDSRIAGVLSRTKALPDDVAALLAEVEAALVKATDELARARETALDPTSTSAAIASARGVTSSANSGCSVSSWRGIGSSRSMRRRSSGLRRSVERRRMPTSSARRDALAARFPDVWASLAVPLSEYLHEVAAVDEEIATSNRLRLGPWLDRTESVARPGVSDLDQHKLVSMATRLPPWDHDAHRSGALLWPPQPERLDPRAMVPAELVKRDEAIAAEAKEAAAECVAA